MEPTLQDTLKRQRRIAHRRKKIEGRRVGMARDAAHRETFHLGGTFMTGQRKMQTEEAGFAACFECGSVGGRHLGVCPRAA